MTADETTGKFPMTTNDNADDEKPLDPAAERLRRKLVMLLVFSMGFLLLSVMTVFGVILYRTMGPSTPAYDGTPIAISLPQGSEIVETRLDGERMLLTLRIGDETRLMILSTETGESLREFVIEGFASQTDPVE